MAQKKEPSRRPGGRKGGRQGRTSQVRSPCPSTRRVDGGKSDFHAARTRYSPQRVARLREIKERPGISKRLVVFSVHTSKVAYQDRCGTDWSRIIGQCTVEFAPRHCDGFSRCSSSCLTFRDEEREAAPGTYNRSHTSLSSRGLE